MQLHSKLITIFSLVFLLSYTTINATIESCSKLIHGKKRVLIIGDLHASGLPITSSLSQLDVQQERLMFKLLEQRTQVSTKTVVMLEASDEDVAVKEELITSSSFFNTSALGMYYNLPFYAKKHNKCVGNVSFVFATVCPQSVRNVLEFFTMFDYQPFHNLPLLFACKEKIKSLLGTTTFKEYFALVEHVIESLQAYRNSSEVNVHLRHYIDLLLVRINCYKQIGYGQFAHEERSYVDVLLEYANKYGLESLIEQCHSWVRPLTNSIFDASFIQHLVKNLVQYDTIIVFAGNDHALVVKNFLRYVGFTLEYERGNLVTNTGSAVFQGPRFSDQELTALFAQAFVVPVGSKQCARCEKPDCTQRCSACKQVYYCSRECQAAHWVMHKTQCNKIVS